MVDGHLFAIGREFQGEWARPLRENAQNVPQPTTLDMKRAWEGAHRDLPPGLVEAEKWNKLFSSCGRKTKFTRLERTWFTTREVYRLRQTLKGAVIGHIDRNIGELSVVCPHLYNKALKTAYSTAARLRADLPLQIQSAGKEWDTRGATTSNTWNAGTKQARQCSRRRQSMGTRVPPMGMAAVRTV